MRQAIYLFFGLCITTPVLAQSTISNQPVEFSVGNGLWGTFLPDYELGVRPDGSAAFRDKLDDVGYIGDLKLVRRFLGTRTSFETRAFYAYAQSSTGSDVTDVDLPNPLTGANTALSGGGTHLKSKVNHYGFDVALRDTWRTRFGGLSAGCGFSYMKFEQTFDAEYALSDLFRERLDSTFVGGKGFVGWDGCIGSCPMTMDLACGIYGLDADYSLDGRSIAGSMHEHAYRNTSTVEANWTTFKTFRGFQIGLNLGAVYLVEMPTIEHHAGSPVTLDFDPAFTLNGMIQILL